MKGSLLSSVFLAGCLTAFGQGKVSLYNDAGSLITDFWTSQPIPTTGPLPGGVVLKVGLYGGTNAASMTLQGYALLNPPGGTGAPAGMVPLTHVVCNFPGGTLSCFVVFVWDSGYATPQAALNAGALVGQNNIFTMTPGSSIQYPLITTGGGSTWTAVGNESPFVVPGEVLVPIQSVTLSGSNIVLTWNGPPSSYGPYVMEYKTDLAQTNWTFLGPVGGTNNVFTDSVQPAPSQRFYRVWHLPF
jgi:hypothetical protein